MKIHLLDEFDGPIGVEHSNAASFPPPQAIRRGGQIFVYASVISAREPSEYVYREARVLDLGDGSESTSADIASVAARGLAHPETLTPEEIKAVCGSALTQVA